MLCYSTSFWVSIHPKAAHYFFAVFRHFLLIFAYFFFCSDEIKQVYNLFQDQWNIFVIQEFEKFPKKWSYLRINIWKLREKGWEKVHQRELSVIDLLCSKAIDWSKWDFKHPPPHHHTTTTHAPMPWITPCTAQLARQPNPQSDPT